MLASLEQGYFLLLLLESLPSLLAFIIRSLSQLYLQLLVALPHLCYLLTFLSHLINESCNLCVLFRNSFLHPLYFLVFLGEESAIEA